MIFVQTLRPMKASEYQLLAEIDRVSLTLEVRVWERSRHCNTCFRESLE